MSTYTGAGETEFEGGNRLTESLRRGLDRILAIELHLTLEFWLYAAVVVAALVFRFADLGTRALHHDESLHATYSWYLATGKGYVHDPLMHGPLLFHITALVYLLFGASDASSRFAPALVGSALVLLPLLLRPWLGRAGTFAAALFLAFSPSLLYYSRFIRHDPFVVFFTLGLIVCMFRYRLARRPGWLYCAAFLLCMSFTSLEITYFISLALLLYLDGCVARTFADNIAARNGLVTYERWLLFAGLLPIAWLLAVAFPFVPDLRARLGGEEELPADAEMLLVLGLLTAPQFSAAVRVPLKSLLHFDLTAGGTVPVLGQNLTRVQFYGGVTVLALLLITFVIGLNWDVKRWLIVAAVFYIPYFVLFTTFFSNRAGFGSGIWGALSYWLDQQNVNRGAQPNFYYAMTLTTYEYLAMALAVAGLIWQAARSGYRNVLALLLAALLIPVMVFVNGHFGHEGNKYSIPFVLAIIGLATAAMAGDSLRMFLVFYFGSLFFAISVAGEKMPWITEHPALPLALLAALFIKDVFEGLIDRVHRRVLVGAAAAAALIAAGAALIAVAPGPGLPVRLLALLVAAAVVVAGAPVLARRLSTPADPDPDAAAPTSPNNVLLKMAILSGACIVAAAVVALFAASGTAGRLRLFAMLLVLDLAVTALAYLVARQPDGRLKRTELRRYGSALAALGAVAVVAFFGVLTIRNDFRMNFIHPDTPDEMLIYTQTSPDIPKVMHQIDELAKESGEGHNLKITVDSNDAFTWPWAWYLRDYHNTGYPDFTAYQQNPSGAASLKPGSVLILNAADQNVAAVFLGQYGPGERFHHRWWFPEDYRSITGPLFKQRLDNGSEWSRWWNYVTHRTGFAVPPSDVNTRAGQVPSIGGPAPAGQEYLGAVDAIAYFPATWVPGKGIDASQPAAPVAAPPRLTGSTLTIGSLGVGHAQFSRPAGLASDINGNIYVADSENNRIQKFDSNGNFVAQVGGPGSSVTFTEPWDVAIGADGSVYVADTWGYRIVKLDRNLAFVKAWGQGNPAAGGPTSPLDLYGPRDIAIDGAGNLWVTDTGNDRVTKFDPNGAPLATFGSKGSGPGQFNEPVGISIAGDGTIYVADTWNNRIEVFDSSFKFKTQIALGGSWVQGQAGTDIENKPFLAALQDGTLLATFPDAGRLVQYDSTGKVLASLDHVSGISTPLQRPLGLSPTASGDVLISDSILNEVIRLPASALR